MGRVDELGAAVTSSTAGLDRWVPGITLVKRNSIDDALADIDYPARHA